MIKLNSPKPDKIDFICNSQDEVDFCNSCKDEIFSDFIRHQTNGKFKTFEEYVQWYYSEPEFGEISIRAKWNQTSEWGLEWNITTIRKLQAMFNEAYNRRREVNV